MGLLQKTGSNHSSSQGKDGAASTASGRCLTLMAEGAALNMPEIDTASYKTFRANVTGMAAKIPDSLPDADKIAVIQNIVHEFESYRANSERVLREQLAGWRTLAGKLLVELLARMGIDPASASAAPLVRRIASLMSAEEIQGFIILLTDFLRVGAVDPRTGMPLQLKGADRSIANDNAAGLRGGGAAVEHVRKIMERGAQGFVVAFHLGFLDVIGERFGMEAVQDSIMAVSAFLTSSLRNNDAIYHWSDSSLLAVLESPATQAILAAAMRRIVDNNRDITVQINDRSVMLRIPLDFEIIPIGSLRSAEDLYKLSHVRTIK